MGTYAWNIFYSKILPAKSRARRRPGRAQSGRTPEFGYGPLVDQSCEWNILTSKEDKKVFSFLFTDSIVIDFGWKNEHWLILYKLLNNTPLPKMDTYKIFDQKYYNWFQTLHFPKWTHTKYLIKNIMYYNCFHKKKRF